MLTVAIEVRYVMILRFAVVLLFTLSAIPAISQEISLVRGVGETHLIDTAYLLIGDKIKRSFRSDYYLTEGALELEEGSWSILAVGMGGDESTMYVTTDLELDFSPTGCVESFGDSWNNAFTISCPLRFFNFEIKTGYELTLLLIIPLDSE
ncbi:MAG: hypothetical protein OXN94_18250 [Chloroflexota bacterium]|nr:hypothetical protein [Chloroflexota bacterium]MDE2859795.1 hypothetical protein [Chloroflexota bacterium]